ncbi:GGDEF domain-containing protein [Pseudomonas quasicaspiana]|uniref:GGDEF domain-containing protein n=1 Tax=Pseudomonas quasicaspiana TaxID=2829821 RepID=UPI000EFEA837|nr:GGDEF domain-containing protein [Pseudomonas quasicaspiana]MCD5976769.1 GGDEF domain-containing protein [Pseudomonas quasicaspiana]
MKIDRLQQLSNDITKELAGQGVKCVIHYKSSGAWIELAKGLAVPQSLATLLDRSSTAATSYHATSSLTAHFHLKAYNAVASLNFPKSPRKETQKKFRELIDRIQESTSNAYKVSHHHLTNLLSKDAFQERLQEHLSYVNYSALDNVDAQESEQPNLVGVLAFDIDYFKQVNDTWGHLYGDQVLKTFGQRLEKCAEKIRSKHPGTIIDIGHPSGEEFLICIASRSEKNQFSAWANDFRLSICEQVLPSDAEWAWLGDHADISILTPPQIPDRRVTTSVGLTLHTSLAGSEFDNDVSAAMLDLADTALYRAKAAGRNQVIAYDEILTSCGRILEHDIRSGVIAIDIGTNVGVTNGQEFKVYHPTYTGSAKFSVNDGRTTRILGMYPRVESARIVIFDAQAEISFAFNESPDIPPQQLEAGSHLEAIPAGSIGHLLSNASKYALSSPDTFGGGDLQSLQDTLINLSNTDSAPFAVVVRFTKDTDFLKKFGTSALNKALAKLYRGAQSAFTNASKIAVLDSGSICIVGANKHYNEESLIKYIEDINTELPLLDIISGVCCKSDISNITESAEITIKFEHAIELARFSAADTGRNLKSRICHFTLGVSDNLLRSQIKLRAASSAYADFKRLIEIGITTAGTYNSGGIIAGLMGDHLLALENYQSAILKSPDTLVYKTNFGTAAFQLDEIDTGLKTLQTLTTAQITESLTAHPYGYFCYAALLAQASLEHLPTFDKARFLLMAEPALHTSTASTLTSYADLIKIELSKLKNSIP